jgi:hypothetical protein
MLNRKFIIASIVFLFMLCLLLPLTDRLAVIVEGSVKVIFPLSEGDSFQLGYIHSVNKSPVWDTVQREGLKLCITESRFYSFGAGIPTSPENEGAVFTVLDDCILLSNINRKFPEISLYVGRVAEHTLKIQGKTFALADISLPGSIMKMKIKKVSLLDIIVLTIQANTVSK